MKSWWLWRPLEVHIEPTQGHAALCTAMWDLCPTSLESV